MRGVARLLLMGVVFAAAALPGCVDAPKVAQGTVVSNDPTTHVLVIKDETAPGRELQLSIENAEIGAAPVAGDLVRVAYRVRNGKLDATRVANLTRQGEIKVRPNK